MILLLKTTRGPLSNLKTFSTWLLGDLQLCSFQFFNYLLHGRQSGLQIFAQFYFSHFVGLHFVQEASVVCAHCLPGALVPAETVHFQKNWRFNFKLCWQQSRKGELPSSRPIEV